ncbi:hypothetical protein GUITHDRAFT_132358 [Guillardia theta CCMP2712]|uniref:Uncharacterized protein n=1 Tax=Guillardia theta (strain CCMP2712) TaxID=905079 RepID=L1JZY2_GUITC|nr:hypothetical protein GUITHDRAFT_132358 [Guillardia theta CCMP2712]EKX53917.1 hypothetical protein GUITHDRAFT_132358 [Guillardia theta CCMP2712]|eukprot:XP_005840897.1 hypothetical protein GUITHDRAFT_132358 [Guillardia theta CCMP2712]
MEASNRWQPNSLSAIDPRISSHRVRDVNLIPEPFFLALRHTLLLLTSAIIRSHGKVWGRYDNLMDIARRPIPPPPPKRGERRTMSQQGGRWSFYEPISEMYVISRVSAQTPGPGSYGERGTPDSVLSTRASPFGKVPGPGQYDTDHLGVTGKIVSSLHQPSSNQFRTAARTSQQILPDNYFESFESMTISGGMPSVRWLFQYMQHQADIIAMEQRLACQRVKCTGSVDA